MKKNNSPVQTEEKKLLKPKNDVVFQSIFNQNNEKITKAFVEALLDEKITKMTINNDQILVRDAPDDKLGILDLELDINNNEKVDVEIQLIERANFAERLLFYFSRLYASQIKRGDDYAEAKKVILIAIIDYPLELTQTISEMETIWKLCEKNHPNLVLTDSIEICILELDKVKNTYYKNKLDKKAQWMLFLDDPNSREVKEIMEKNNDIKDAVIEVHERSKDEQLRRIAELKEKAIMDEKAIYKAGRLRGEKEGIQEGLQKGITQGQLEKSIEIIKNLHSMNLTVSQIAQAVDMSEQEVQKIIDENS